MSHILVVDDETNVAKSVLRLLEENNFKVFIASNGEAALDMLATEKSISIVISDQRMPLMTGAELFKKMKTSYPNVKRVLLTGYTEMETLRKAINQGSIFKLLLKPWDDDELITCIKDAQAVFNLEKKNQAINEKLTKLNFNLERSVTRKNRELNMKIQSLERYEKILEQLPIGIVCISEDDMIVLTNHQFNLDFELENAVEGIPYTRALPSVLHQFIEQFEPGRHKTIEYKGKRLYLTFNTLSDNDTVFGKTLSVRTE